MLDLSRIRPGDEIAIFGSGRGPVAIRKVHRVLRLSVEDDSGAFWNARGQRPGRDRGSRHATYATLATDEHRAAFRRERAVSALARLREEQIRDLPLEVLEAAAALLYPKKESP